MDEHFIALAAHAANQHGLFDIDEARRFGVSDGMRRYWCRVGLLEQLAPRVFRVAGTPATWGQRLLVGLRSLPAGAAGAGRSAARLIGLDGFTTDSLEFLGPRSARSRSIDGLVCYSSRRVAAGDLRVIDGITVLRAERLILESPLFGFTVRETENAIDSAIRLRQTTDARLRHRFATEVPTGVNGRSILAAALIDTGGESQFERRFLQLIRTAGLPRPHLQRTYRDGGRTLARVDAEFPNGLVVELNGHATHSSRAQRQRDAQRHTELTLRGKRVLTFTFEDQRDRPDWMIRVLRAAGVAAA